MCVLTAKQDGEGICVSGFNRVYNRGYNRLMSCNELAVVCVGLVTSSSSKLL